MINAESPEQPYRSLNTTGQKMTSEKDRRSKMEMYLDILRAIGAGAEKPTHVMYKANLSWVVMRGFLENLKAQGLVEETLVEGRSTLRLTNRGYELLNQFLLVREYFVNIS
jgi:predicted transcriptional regulator